MKYYHAAPREIMVKIAGEGIIKKSWDGMVYLCKEAVDSCKFLIMRGMKEMSVIEIELDENDLNLYMTLIPLKYSFCASSILEFLSIKVKL